MTSVTPAAGAAAIRREVLEAPEALEVREPRKITNSPAASPIPVTPQPSTTNRQNCPVAISSTKITPCTVRSRISASPARVRGPLGYMTEDRCPFKTRATPSGTHSATAAATAENRGTSRRQNTNTPTTKNPATSTAPRECTAYEYPASSAEPTAARYCPRTDRAVSQLCTASKNASTRTG